MATRLTRWPAVVGGALLFGAAVLYHGAPGPRISGDAMLTSNRRWVVWDSLRLLDRALDLARIDAGEYGPMAPAPGQVAGLRFDAPDGRPRPAPSEWLAPYRDGLARLPAHAAEVGTVVRFGWAWWGDLFIAPQAGPASPCFIRGWEGTPGSQVDPATALGACGFYAAFGRPGPKVGAWMSRSYAGYSAEPPGWAYHPDTTDWNEKQIRNWQTNGWTMRLVRAGLPPEYFGAMNAAGCIAGRPGRCVAAVEAVRPARRMVDQGDGLGPVDAMMLPDLVSQFGVPRFRAFWKSEADLPTAFARAFGVPMETWVRSEALGYYGPLEAGAGDLGRSALTAIGWSVLLLVVTAGLARRLRA